MSSRRGLVRSAASWVAWWVACMLLWLLLTSTIDPAEVLVGAGAAVLGATAAAVVRRKGGSRIQVRLRWFRTAWLVPLRIATETWDVFAVLVAHATGRRRVRGTLQAVPFRHGGESPRQDARRAIATTGISMVPNTFVIGIDARRDEMLVHQLRADPGALERMLGRP